jgi:hypothetical protein
MNIYIVLEVNMEVVCNATLLELVPYYDSIMLFNQGVGFVGAHLSNLFSHKVIKKLVFTPTCLCFMVGTFDKLDKHEAFSLPIISNMNVGTMLTLGSIFFFNDQYFHFAWC